MDPGFPLTIGSNCVIGHLVMLHGCTIGDNSLIGMGAVLLNGSKIGSNCLVGAGAVVTESKSFPDHSLIVGAPARVIRSLDAKAIEMIRGGADIYVKRSKLYAKALKKIFRKDNPIKIIGTRHGEKLYESLVPREEMAKALDLDRYYRIPADNRDLNYNKYFVEDETKISGFEDYTSHNTERLDIERVRKLLSRLAFIREELRA